jgi:nucleoside-diphosphate-sugar epimerase
MKLLVTGAAGFVGSILCKLALDQGHEVLAIDNFFKGHCDSLTPFCENKNFKFVFGDITNVDDVKKMVSGADAVINLAAIVGFPICSRYPAQARLVNIKGVNNLITYRNSNIPIIQASTGSQYGKVDGICTEDSPQNTDTVYGITKKYAEEYLLQVDNTYSLRFATAFGLSPNMRINLLINDLVTKAITEKSLSIFEADARRTFIHVRDMAASFLLALDCHFKGTLKHRVYNVGHDSMNKTKREICEYLKEKTGCVVYYNDNRADPDKRDYEVNYSRWMNDTGFTPSITINEGIDHLIKAVGTMNLNRYYQ